MNLRASERLVILGEIARADSLCEQVMHIKVVPLLTRRQPMRLEPIIVLLGCDHSLGHGVVRVVKQVLLGQADHNGGAGDDTSDLTGPLGHIFAGFFGVYRDTDNEDVCAHILHFAVLGEGCVAARIVDLDLNLLLPDILRPAVQIEHGRLVILRKLIVQVVPYKARLAH